jgi:hypothetical protein
MIELCCSGESLDLRRRFGRGRIARSGYIGDAVSGDRATEKDEERE